MNIDFAAFITACLSLFAIVDPVGGIPVFVGLTRGIDDRERRRVMRLAVLTAFALVLAFALTGTVIMREVFHITMSEFTFAGGLLLVVVGIRDMMAAGGIEEDTAQKHPLHYRAVAISPIAIPLLAGPGTIVTVILYQDQYGLLFVLLMCLAVFSVSLLVLSFSGAISRVLGRVGMLAVSRVMQIFIIAIGVRFMFMGLRESFPGLFGG